MSSTPEGRPRARTRPGRGPAALATLALGIGALTGCSGGSGTTTAAPPDATTSRTATAVYSFVPPVRAQTGVDVTDTEHGYHLLVSPDWVAYTDLAPDDPAHAAWAVGPAADGMTPSVSVVTEAAPGMSLSDYLDLSIRNLPHFMSDAEVRGTGKVKALDGSTLATIEYTGMGVRFLAVIAMGHGHAVVVTLVASPTSFDQTREQALPYLLTLTATG